MTQKTRATVSTYSNMHTIEVCGQEYRIEFLNGPHRIVTNKGTKQVAFGEVFKVDDGEIGHFSGKIFVPVTDAGNARPHEIEAAVRAL